MRDGTGTAPARTLVGGRLPRRPAEGARPPKRALLNGPFSRSAQVLQLLGSTAPTALIGLITFGTTVQVHELGYEHCVKSYTFSGQKDIEPQKLAELLGIGQPQRGARGAAAPDARAAQGRFLLPVAEAEFAISSVRPGRIRPSGPPPLGLGVARCSAVLRHGHASPHEPCLCPTALASRLRQLRKG